MVAPWLVAFGTGLLTQYNKRSRAKTASDYEMAIKEKDDTLEREKLWEDRDYNWGVKRAENKWKIAAADKKQAHELELEKLKNTVTDSATAYNDTNYHTFGKGNDTLFLRRYVSTDGNPEVGPDWDNKRMNDLDSLSNSAGFKEKIKNLDDSNRSKLLTYATQLFSDYRVSNANELETGEIKGYARIHPNAQGKGKFQNLFNKDKWPLAAGINEAYVTSTDYIMAKSFNDAKSKYTNTDGLYLMSDTEGEFDNIMTVEDLKDTYPNTPIEDLMASADLVKHYSPMFADNRQGTEGNMVVLKNLEGSPKQILSVKYTNKYNRLNQKSDGDKLMAFWNENTEAYGHSTGYETDSTGQVIDVGTNHEARLDSLALTIPSKITSGGASFVEIIDNAKVAREQIIGATTTVSDLENISTQGTTAFNLMTDILTTYDPAYGGMPVAGGVLNIFTMIEGVFSQFEQVGMIGDFIGKDDVNTYINQIYSDREKLSPMTKKAISKFEFEDNEYDLRDAMFGTDERISQIAKRKFFATALNYTVSMILQGGTGGKTISDNDYRIMEQAMYNGLWVSGGLNMSALDAIYDALELPVLLAQYKTDIDAPNAIQRMKAAKGYERLVNYDSRRHYRELSSKLLKHSDPVQQETYKAIEFFQGRTFPDDNSESKVTRMNEKNGKVYFEYHYLNQKISMPMPLFVVKKLYPKSYEANKDNYLNFGDEIFDKYRERFGSPDENPEGLENRKIIDVPLDNSMFENQTGTETYVEVN